MWRVPGHGFTVLAKYGSLAFVLVFSLAACRVDATSAVGKGNNRNATALQNAKENIERHRKAKAHIKVLDQKGRPVSGVNLDIKQTSHDFKFGCYLKIDDLASNKLPEYEAHFSKLFNYSVVGVYWDFIEGKEKAPDWTWFERETALGRKLGTRIQAAPVLWGTNSFGTPKWLANEKESLSLVLRDHVRAALAKGSETVDDWEVVNEPLAPKGDKFSVVAGPEYISSAFTVAREAAPRKSLMINEFGVFGSVASNNYNGDKYFDLVRGLIASDVPIDVIGLQAHSNGEWYEPANVAEQLDRYAALGKPIQITEFSAQTSEYKDRRTPLKISGGYRSGVWDNDKQAEFYREFYTIAFANPAVEAIVTWGLDDERAWLPGIGLVGKDFKEKAAYATLDSLINREWRTTLSGTSSDAGVFEFDGFFGNYEVRASLVNSPGRSQSFSISRGRSNEWVIKLAD